MASRLNAPEFAYYTLYDKKPSGIRGRTYEHPKKEIEGIEIDKGIPTKAIKELMEIGEIETRASCQGSSENRPSFLILRPVYQKANYVKKFVKNLNNQDKIKARFDVGRERKFRVCVTWYTWEGKEGNEEWWLSLPKKIRKSL